MTDRFAAYCRRKEHAAIEADIPGYHNRRIGPEPDAPLIAIGNDWSRGLFGGNFYRSAMPSADGVPITSLVFVQSRNGNTVAPDPSVLGGGDTDLHLVYEGLSRVDADAVMAGAATARGKDIVFSVWHPRLVDLRCARGKPRHPAQVIVTDRGDLRWDDGLMFLEPELRVFVIARSGVVDQIRRRIEGRPWITIVEGGEPLSLTRALRTLRTAGVEVLSCVGGRRTAITLLNEHLVRDIYLTTSAIDGGEPNTPYYEQQPPAALRIVLKEGRGPEAGVRFEHLLVNNEQVSR